MIRNVVWMLGLVLLAEPALAGRSIGRVISISGEVTGTLKDDVSKFPIRRGFRIPPGMRLDTGTAGAVRILMADRSIMALGSGTSMSFDSYAVELKSRKRKVGLRLWSGRVWARVAKFFGSERKANWRISSANAVAGVRGTELFFGVNEETGESEVTCVTGSVDVENASGDLANIGPMEQSTVGASGATSTGSVDAARVAAMKQSVSSGELGDGGSDGRIAQASEKVGDPPGDEDKAGNDDGLDLDPASGLARVRLRLLVRRRP